MTLNQQPLRGIIPIIFVLIASVLFILMGKIFFGLDAAMLSVYALFFVWTAFLISMCDRWPVQKLRQPVAGFIFLAVALIIGILHPVIMQVLGFSPDFYWPLISNLFLGIGILIAFGNKLVDGFTQPTAIALNALFCYVLAILLIQVFGMVPAIWFAIFVFVVFWLEVWPVSQVAQPAKGILTFVLIGAITLVLEYGFKAAGTDFFKPEAGLWFVLFVWWLVATSWQLETWPVKLVAQPVKAIAGLGVSIILTFASYYAIVSVFRFDPGTVGGFVWVFVAWLYTWEIVLGKWPADRSSPKEDPSATNQ